MANTKDESYNQAMAFSALCERTPHNKKKLPTKDIRKRHDSRNDNQNSKKI